MQVFLDNVCDCVNTALFCLPSDGEGLTLCPEKGKKSLFCSVWIRAIYTGVHAVLRHGMLEVRAAWIILNSCLVSGN